MLRFLLHEILKKDEYLFMHFQPEYRNLRCPDADQPLKAWEYEQLKAVLRACLEHPLKRSFFLIIDTMDELTILIGQILLISYGNPRCLPMQIDASSKSFLLVAL